MRADGLVVAVDGGGVKTLPEELSALRAVMARLGWSEQFVIGKGLDAIATDAPAHGRARAELDAAVAAMG